MILSKPGLYRIRRCGRSDLDYIGQTGSGTMTLRKRLGMLKGVYADVMPYRDPHTAAPALWALRHHLNCMFEVSVLPLQGDTSWRKGLEALATSLYRQQEGRSPNVNFGRILEGYSISSSNNKRLVDAGKRFRGGLTNRTEANHLPSMPPVGSLVDDPRSLNWCGHQWSQWQPLSTVVQQLPADKYGLYRLQSAHQTGLVYIGQGLVKARLNIHLKKASKPPEKQDKQGEVFTSAEPLECSWVLNQDWHLHQRLELENDLIASHLLVTEQVPAAQFMG
ncbi:hypothetical protein [Oculatella sp. FACHB-28]|uniref:hypothetical protein n=1 Tax=Oculatella sp. FACHB-28 TaxID=2692845 RepID=UPI001682D00E|nr:hypothetical protein [Oculatella sp. FACHB-28]